MLPAAVKAAAIAAETEAEAVITVKRLQLRAEASRQAAEAASPQRAAAASRQRAAARLNKDRCRSRSRTESGIMARQ